MELNLAISNVKCGGCVSNIESGLKTINGIASVEVNIENGTVKITGSDLNHSEISTKLSDLGYPEK